MGKTNAVIWLHNTFTFAQLVDVICGKFDGLVPRAVYILFNVPGYNKFKVYNDDDIQDTLCLAKLFGVNHIDVMIQTQSVRLDGNGKRVDCMEDGGNSHIGNQTFSLDDQTNLLPAYCLNKSKLFLSVKWAYGIFHIATHTPLIGVHILFLHNNVYI
ncbi:hypothetical protein ACSBR2_023999 [Camellia fascicularis]